MELRDDLATCYNTSNLKCKTKNRTCAEQAIAQRLVEFIEYFLADVADQVHDYSCALTTRWSFASNSSNSSNRLFRRTQESQKTQEC